MPLPSPYKNPQEARYAQNGALPPDLSLIAKARAGLSVRVLLNVEKTGMGDPFFDLGNFSINHELTPDEDRILLAA